MRMSGKEQGFTLIELVMVIAILGILAAVALPRFQDLSGAAREASTRGALGALRSALAIRYAQSGTAGGAATYPASITGADFADGQLPRNVLNAADRNAITVTASVVNGTTTSTTGFWYVQTGADAGRAGAFAGTADTDTGNY